MDYRDKTVWITGASSGIGLELARQLASRGARLVLSARSEATLSELRDSLPGGAEQHWVEPLDLADPEALLPQGEAILQRVGPVDVLINNGGVSQRSRFIDTDFSVYRRLMEVNYLGSVALTKVVLQGMISRGRGSIVAVSSVAGLVGSQLRSGYSGSKFAVVGFMDCLRAETAKQGIHCLTVCPGSINTAIAINALTADGSAQQRDDEGNLNGLSAEDCARQIVRAMDKGRDQVVIGRGLSGLAPTIKRLLPSLYNRLSARIEYR